MGYEGDGMWGVRRDAGADGIQVLGCRGRWDAGEDAMWVHAQPCTQNQPH